MAVLSRKLLLLLYCLSFFFLNSQAADIIDVTGFGAVPNSFGDATVSLQKAIAQCVAGKEWVLVFPKGRYDFWPDKADVRNYYISNTSADYECPSKLKKIALLFENKSNITIEGNGSLFMFHGKLITWAFDHCTHIRLQNAVVDFERPTMSEMRFIEVSDSSARVAVDPDSRFAIINDSLRWYGEGWGMRNYFALLVNPADSTLRYDSWQPFVGAKATLLPDRTVLFRGNFKGKPYKPGMILTVRDPIRDHVGVFINLSKGITFENVQLHYMHGLGVISQFSEDLLFDRVAIVPSGSRTIAAFADCMHFSGCRGHVELRGCHFKGSHDDPINVHGTQLLITETLSSNRVKLRFGHAQSYGFPAYFPGDTVQFVHGATLQGYFTAVVAEAKMISDKEMEVSFMGKAPAGIEKGDCLENITWTPSLTVRDCLFEATNARGLLVTTCRKVVIDHNVFSKTGMQAILIADDASSWFESGPVRDVTISRNTFINCGYNLGERNYTISIMPENHLLLKNVYIHSNIRIEQNTFYTTGTALLTARSTDNLVFSGNTIVRGNTASPAGAKAVSSAGADAGSSAGVPGFIDLVACGKVTISGNILDGSKMITGKNPSFP